MKDGRRNDNFNKLSITQRDKGLERRENKHSLYPDVNF